MLEFYSMFDKVNLKDPKYLQDYENQIRKLPLDELYEVLDIVKKDKTSERIDIVNKRIGELETSDRLPRILKKSRKQLTKPTRNIRM